MYSHDFRWRAVAIHYAYSVPSEQVARIFGVSGRAVRRWYTQFKASGDVGSATTRKQKPRDPLVLSFVQQYVKNHPCFYVEELQSALRRQFAEYASTFSASTVLRILRHDLLLSRKVLERRAREALPFELATFATKSRCWYGHPSQLVFVDETSKNGRSAARRLAWSRRGTPAVARVPFTRGQRVSILAACDSTGFFAWRTTRGTFRA